MNILIVDDDLFNLKLMSDILADAGSCATAKNGDEAIALFNAALDAGNPFDLVCLDIVMPGMSGHQVLRQIREIEEAAGRGDGDGAKVIMVTSEADVDTILVSYNYKCDAYITKPVNMDVIMDKLRFMGLR